MNLDQFLTTYVDGYLLKDLETLRAAKPEPDADCGYVGYPLLQTLFSGIELLGALTSVSKPFDGEAHGAEYFASFWSRMHGGHKARGEVGPAIYKLCRHGLAHSFRLKGRFVVTKRKGSAHLKWVGDALYVDAIELLEQFTGAYGKLDLRNDTKWPQAQQHLQEMDDDASKDWDRLSKQFRRLERVPLTTPPASGPTPSPAPFPQSLNLPPPNNQSK